MALFGDTSTVSNQTNIGASDQAKVLHGNNNLSAEGGGVALGTNAHLQAGGTTLGNVTGGLTINNTGSDASSIISSLANLFPNLGAGSGSSGSTVVTTPQQLPAVNDTGSTGTTATTHISKTLLWASIAGIVLAIASLLFLLRHK